MTKITKSEYLALINQLLQQQYDDEKETELEEDSWIPSESPLKDKIPFAVQSGVIDLTNSKIDKIKISIENANSFKVGNFLINVNKIRKTAIAGYNVSLYITVFEEKFKTPSGHPCRMTYSVNISKDPRFEQYINLSSFSGNSASNVNNDVLFNLIRWMQALKRMTAFL